MSYTNALHLGNTQQEWLRKLDFYETEMEFLKKRLAEIVRKNTAGKTMAQAAHFQNQFVVQQSNIDELKHQINSNAHLVSDDARQHGGKIEGSLLEDHQKIERDVDELEMIIKELRGDFNKYLAKWI